MALATATTDPLCLFLFLGSTHGTGSTAAKKNIQVLLGMMSRCAYEFAKTGAYRNTLVNEGSIPALAVRHPELPNAMHMIPHTIKSRLIESCSSLRR